MMLQLNTVTHEGNSLETSSAINCSVESTGNYSITPPTLKEQSSRLNMKHDNTHAHYEHAMGVSLKAKPRMVDASGKMHEFL